MRLSLFRWSAVVLIGLPCVRLRAQEARTALLAADKRAAELSLGSRLSLALQQTLDSTGALLWPGAPVLLGLADVRKWVRARPDIDSLRLSWQPLGIELSGDSTVGVTWGVAVTARPANLDPPRIGRYIAAWRRKATEWNIAALLLVGITLPGSGRSPEGLPLTRKPAAASGPSALFIAADLDFARLAADSGASKAFQTWAAEEALSFGGGSLLIRGPTAIGQAVSGPEQWRWRPVAAGAAPSGDLGWTVGEAVIGAGGAEPYYSKYLTIWSRRGKTTRFLLDGGNARPPAPWAP